MSSARAVAGHAVAALLIGSLALFTGACGVAGPPKPDILTRQAAYRAISASVGRPFTLKTLSLTKFPSGPGYEIKEVDGPGYFVVDAASGEIGYAVLDEIKAKSTGIKIDLKQAGRLARAWAARRPVFKDFRYLDKQTDLHWPKAGYFTAVWAGAPPRRSGREFAKVTVDLITGKVVSFGIGDPKWSMFCLPPGVIEKGNRE